MRIDLDALRDVRRYPLAAGVTSGLGKPDEVRFGLEGGEVVVLCPPGEGFRANPSQLADLIAALQTVGWAAELQRADLDPTRRSASRRAGMPAAYQPTTTNGDAR